jgi:secondary thiamine-phosphate synthase enzyme
MVGMRQHLHSLHVTAPAQGLRAVTNEVRSWVAETGVQTGLLTLFCRHTSASLLIQENAAPAARHDLERYFARIAPESAEYEHGDEGPDDMPAHLRAALTQTQLSIPVGGGRPLLGTWRAFFVFVLRRVRPEGVILLHLLGE